MLYVKILKTVPVRAGQMLVLGMCLVWFVHITVLLQLPILHPTRTTQSTCPGTKAVQVQAPASHGLAHALHLQAV